MSRYELGACLTYGPLVVLEVTEKRFLRRDRVFEIFRLPGSSFWRYSGSGKYCENRLDRDADAKLNDVLCKSIIAGSYA